MSLCPLRGSPLFGGVWGGPYPPFAGLEVDFEAFAVVEFAVGATEGDGEDDDLRVWQVGIHPAVADIEIGGLLRAANGEDGGSLCAIGHLVADVAQGNPALCEVVGIGHLTLVGLPPRAGRVEHEVEGLVASLCSGEFHDGGCLATIALEERRVGYGCQVIVGELEQSEIGVLLGCRDEVGGAVVIDEDVAIAALDSHRPPRPHKLVAAVDGIALEAGGLGSSVVARLPVTPHDVLPCFLVVEQLGSLNHASAAEVGRGHSVLNDLLHKRPVLQVGRRIEVDIGVEGVGAVFADHIPCVALFEEAWRMGLHDVSLGVGPHLAVPDLRPLILFLLALLRIIAPCPNRCGEAEEQNEC